MWSTCRGPGIVWYGDDTKRSDLLMLLNCIVRPGVGFYGLDWNGNCNSLVVKYLGIVCGSSVGAGNAKGAVIRNTAGITTFPAIGRFTHIDVDYPTGPGLEILSGLDYDLATPYILGSNSDGIKIGALINDYEVRLTGGKSTGNTGWGVNNLGGVVLTSGSTSFNSNTAGETTGNVWTRTPRIHLDTNAYYTISGVSPLLSFDLNDYISYDRTNNVYGSYIGGVAIQSIRATYVQAHKPLVHPAYTVATLPTGVQWMRAFVSDATVTTFNSVVAGGGTNKVPVFYDGAAWRIG